MERGIAVTANGRGSGIVESALTAADASILRVYKRPVVSLRRRGRVVRLLQQGNDLLVVHLVDGACSGVSLPRHQCDHTQEEDEHEQDEPHERPRSSHPRDRN